MSPRGVQGELPGMPTPPPAPTPSRSPKGTTIRRLRTRSGNPLCEACVASALRARASGPVQVAAYRQTFPDGTRRDLCATCAETETRRTP